MPLPFNSIISLSLNLLQEHQKWPVTDTVSILRTKMSCLYLITSGISISFINKWQCGSLYISLNILRQLFPISHFFVLILTLYKKKKKWVLEEPQYKFKWPLHTQQQATCMSTQRFNNKINFFVNNQTYKNIMCTQMYIQ